MRPPKSGAIPCTTSRSPELREIAASQLYKFIPQSIILCVSNLPSKSQAELSRDDPDQGCHPQNSPCRREHPLIYALEISSVTDWSRDLPSLRYSGLAYEDLEISANLILSSCFPLMPVRLDNRSFVSLKTSPWWLLAIAAEEL